MQINKKTLKQIAIGTAIGFGISAVILTIVAKDAHILKRVSWTPDGDMLLAFYHRKGAYLIPKPE